MEQDPFTPPTPPPPTNMTPLPLPPEGPDAAGPYGGGPVFYCVGCGQPLNDALLGGQCPHCGTPTDHSIRNPTPHGTPGSAVAALVLGIAAIVSCMLYGLPAIVCGILAVYFAGRADRMMNSGQYSTQGRGMATAGRICGWIGLALGIIYIVLLVAWIAFAVSMSSNMNNNWNQPPSQQPWNTPGNNPSYPAVQPHPVLEDADADAIEDAINEAFDSANDAVDDAGDARP